MDGLWVTVLTMLSSEKTNSVTRISGEGVRDEMGGGDWEAGDNDMWVGQESCL